MPFSETVFRSIIHILRDFSNIHQTASHVTNEPLKILMACPHNSAKDFNDSGNNDD